MCLYPILVVVSLCVCELYELRCVEGNGETTDEFYNVVCSFERWSITGDGKIVTTIESEEDVVWENDVCYSTRFFGCRRVREGGNRRGG